MPKSYPNASQLHRTAKKAILACRLTVVAICYLICDMKKHLSLLTGFLLLICCYCGAEPEKWLTAAQQGDAKAQYELGVCYDFGNGVLKDPTMAKEWIKKASENGHHSAADTWKALELWKY